MKLQKKIGLLFVRFKLRFLAVINKRLAGKAAFDIFCTPLPAVKSNKSTILDNGENLELTLNGLRVKGVRLNKGKRVKILILHGFSSSSRNFHHYVAGLVRKDYEVIAFDAPAHGLSEGKRTNAVDYSDMIKALYKAYGPFDGYLAHSFGGIAVSLALEELPHDSATRLVLIAPATETISAIDGALNFLGVNNEVLKNALKGEIFNLSGKKAEWFSVRRAVNNIEANILWIHDEDDDVTPLEDALKVKEDDHPNIKFLITKGLGHRRIYRDPAIREAVLDFL